MMNGQSVTALNNYFQGRREAHLLSCKESSAGLPHALVWTVEYKVRGEVFGTGTAGQVRIARERAAQVACQRLGIPV